MPNTETTALQLILSDLETLLNGSGHSDKALWLSARRTILCKSTVEEVRAALQEVRSHIAGMGSLSDLYLQPDSNTELSRQEAQSRLLELLDQLYYEIRRVQDALPL